MEARARRVGAAATGVDGGLNLGGRDQTELITRLTDATVASSTKWPVATGLSRATRLPLPMSTHSLPAPAPAPASGRPRPHLGIGSGERSQNRTVGGVLCRARQRG